MPIHVPAKSRHIHPQLATFAPIWGKGILSWCIIHRYGANEAKTLASRTHKTRPTSVAGFLSETAPKGSGLLLEGGIQNMKPVSNMPRSWVVLLKLDSPNPAGVDAAT